MRITYNTHQPIGGVGLTPWMRMGPERWFPEYIIFSQEGAVGTPAKVVVPGGEYASTKAMLKSPDITRAIIDVLPPAPLLTSRPAELSRQLKDAGYTLFALNPELTHTLENKAEFRIALSDTVPFPPYALYERKNMVPSAADFKRIAAGRKICVMQDELSTGGRGTHIVRGLESYQRALASLLFTGPRVVVSDFIAGRERTLQCCVTQAGTLVGPLQKQVVGDPNLTNMNIVQGDRFCGGEIDPNDPCLSAYPAMKRIAQTVGRALRTHGYRGIFGLDFIITPAGQTFLLELNPRFTGMTPLLTRAWRDEHDIPFYMLHILELCSLPYTVSGLADIAAPPACAQLILYSHENVPVHLPGLLSGVYAWNPEAQSVHFVRPGYALSDLTHTSEFLLERHQLDTHIYKPGQRLVKLFFNRTVLDERDAVTPQIQLLVDAVYAQLATIVQS